MLVLLMLALEGNRDTHSKSDDRAHGRERCCVSRLSDDGLNQFAGGLVKADSGELH